MESKITGIAWQRAHPSGRETRLGPAKKRSERLEKEEAGSRDKQKGPASRA